MEWLVMRQDDNGNVFIVSEHLSEAPARRHAAELEARAHKQIYWVEHVRNAQPPRHD
jgi:hypothetical protein